MKNIINKIKGFFKSVSGTIEKHTDNERYTAFLIFLFYVSLSIGAVAFLYGLFEAMKFKGAFLIVLGSYLSVRILYNFIKDFVGLIIFYIRDKKEKDSEK